MGKTEFINNVNQLKVTNQLKKIVIDALIKTVAEYLHTHYNDTRIEIINYIVSKIQSTIDQCASIIFSEYVDYINSKNEPCNPIELFASYYQNSAVHSSEVSKTIVHMCNTIHELEIQYWIDLVANARQKHTNSFNESELV